MPPRPVLYVFARAPVMGAAKTRLAADLGGAQAMRLYRAMTASLLRRVRDPRWDTVLAVAPDAALDARFACWPADLPRIAQGGGNLGARQARVFARPGPAAVIGTDAPGLRRADVAAAFAALGGRGGAGSAVGPAEDGGYWLLALNGPAPPGLFDGVRWSTPHTLADLRPRLPRPAADLRRLRDIDSAADLAPPERA